MKKNKNNNKIVMIIIMIISILAIGGLVYASIVLNKQEEDLNKYLVELSYKELSKKLEKKESFILVVTRTDCSHCAVYKPKLKQVLKDYNIIGYEIAADKLSTKDKSAFNDIANVSGTPTTIFIVNGEEETTTNRLVGDVPTERIISRLKSQGYIKGE